MAKWKPGKTRYEPPEWYRVYHWQMWDEPDDLERRMVAGCPSMRPWPDELHDYHSRRRWFQAQCDYRQSNPEFASQEFADFMESVRERRAGR